jgi:hypothetical protein
MIPASSKAHLIKFRCNFISKEKKIPKYHDVNLLANPQDTTAKLLQFTV